MEERSDVLAQARVGIARLGAVLLLGMALVLAPTAAASLTGTDVVVPTSASAGGAYGSYWMTTLWVTNGSMAPTDVEMAFLERDVSNTAPVLYRVTMAPGESRSWEDAVKTLFGKTGTAGAIRLRSTNDVLVVSRTYNDAGGDISNSVGTSLEAVPAGMGAGIGRTTTFLGVTPDGSGVFRYNFGLVEVDGKAVTLRIVLRDGAGSLLGSVEAPVRALEMKQYAVSDLFPGATAPTAAVDVTVTAGNGRVVGFSTLIPNGSNSPTGFGMSLDTQSFIGPQGIAGPQGPAGATGQQGIQGVAGAQGPAGPMGAQGAHGLKGDTGTQGATGARGETGTSPFTLNGVDAVYTAGSLGVGVSPPNAAAALDVASTTKGFLPPRMTRDQRVAIANPVAGLQVYQTDTQTGSSPGLYQYSGTAWVQVGAGVASGTVTSVATGTGLTGGPITAAGTISLANTAVTPSSYTRASITVDQQGRLTAASSGPAIGLSGSDVTGTLPVASGGTGTATAPTPGGVIYAGSGTAYASTGAGTTGQVLTSAGAGAPTWATAAAGPWAVSVNDIANSNSGKVTVTNLTLPDPTAQAVGLYLASGTGPVPFLHAYGNYTSNGRSMGNLFAGVNAGNASMSTASPTADWNTGVGYSSLNSLTTGSTNTGVGYYSLRLLTTGGNNTGVGAFSVGGFTDAVTGSNNTGIGASSLTRLTSGSWNTAAGSNALEKNATGSQNAAFGTSALESNIEGVGNAAFGTRALSSATSGGNTAIGTYAGLNIAGGDGNNTVVGNQAGWGISTGTYNTAMGYQAALSSSLGGLPLLTGGHNIAVGVNAGYKLTSGSYNIALGDFGGSALTTGSYNIDIGHVGVAAEANTIRIGTELASGVGQDKIFIAGIKDVTLSGTPKNVVIDPTTGQLGAAVGGGSGVTSVDVSGGTTGLTTSGGPVTTTGTITLAGTLGVVNGGTGTVTAPTQGGVIYAGSGSAYASTGAGSTGQVLTSNGAGAPTWAAASAGPWTTTGNNVANSNSGTVTVKLLTLPNPTVQRAGLYMTGGGSIVPFLHAYGVATDGTDSRNLFAGVNAGNTTSGSYAMTSAATDNTGVGAQSLQALTSGGSNTGVGSQSLMALTSGLYNTGVGYGSLQLLTTTAGSYNTALGANAGVQLVDSANNNVFVGFNAGSSVLTGSYNIDIGHVGADEANTIRIGNAYSAGTGQNKTFIAGIKDVTLSGTPKSVVIDAATGQLGAVTGGGGGGVTSVDVSGGTTGLTTSGGPVTTTGTITLAGTLGVVNGGTGTVTAPTQGGVIYAGSGSAYASTGAGSTGQVLTSNGTGAPTWAAAGGPWTVSGTNIVNSNTGTVTVTKLTLPNPRVQPVALYVYDVPFLSAYSGYPSSTGLDGGNVFLGGYAGNSTMQESATSRAVF